MAVLISFYSFDIMLLGSFTFKVPYVIQNNMFKKIAFAYNLVQRKKDENEFKI